MSRNPHDVIKAPVITEESTIQSETRNQYVFRVAPGANKPEIRDAVERLFNVKVLAVNTCNYPGKRRRRGMHYGRTAHWKKAVVTLREGDSIDLI
jgi:large subunit ribosomal protein L23